MASKTITTCDFCGTDEGAEGYWATIKFKSLQYLFDDGTQDQVYEWHACRECKLDVIRFMEGDRKVKLTQKMRSAMAKSLRAFLAENGVEIKHTVAVRAVASMFGYNEHSMAEAVRDGKVTLEIA